MGAQQPPCGVHIVNSTQNPPLIRLWDLHIPSYPLLFEELIRIYENPSSHFLIYWTWFGLQIFLDEKIFSWMTKYFLSFFHFQILTSPASVTASRESYLPVSVISWVRLQSGNNQKSVSALHTTVSDSVTFCSVVYIYCFGKCLGLLCQLHCHVLKIRSKIVGGSAIDFEFLMPTTDGAKRVRYGWKFWMFTESQCFNRATTWQTFERLCCDLEQNATKRKSKQASKQSEK